MTAIETIVASTIFVIGFNIAWLITNKPKGYFELFNIRKNKVLAVALWLYNSIPFGLIGLYKLTS